jgi:hypothetical protein
LRVSLNKLFHKSILKGHGFSHATIRPKEF